MSFALIQNGFHQIKSIVACAAISFVFIAVTGGVAMAWEVTLAWDPNREANLDGYTVYYSKQSPGPPYDYVGDLPLSEVANPERPTASVSNLEKHVNYYFALTAYDTDGNESSFSQQLCVRADEAVYECAPADSMSSSGGGSGSSAACFVRTAQGCDRDTVPCGLSMLLFGLAAVLAFISPTLFDRRDWHCSNVKTGKPQNS